MAQLSDLPNEITLMIISLILPDDLENFTSTCWKIYRMATEELERHRSLIRRYAVFRFRTPHSSSLHANLVQLLEDILREPRTAFYIQKLSTHHEFVRWDARERFLHPTQRQDTWSRLIEGVATLAPPDEVLKWSTHLPVGREDLIISMLLLVVPNLSTLDLQYRGEVQWCFHDALCHIIKMKRPGAPLARLRCVQITDLDGTNGLCLIRLFAALPSMRSIHGVQIASGSDGWQDVVLAPRSSDVEILSLTGCLTGPKHLFDLFETFKTLRSFTYDWNVSALHAMGEEVDPFWIRKALSAFAWSSLESLTLLSHARKRKFIGDLRCFETLRNLHTETQLLLRQSDLFHESGSLAMMLPPTIETLKLECSGSGDEEEIAEMIHTLAKLKTEHVPALRKVEVFTLNGAKDFNTARDRGAAARGFTGGLAHVKGRTYDGVVAKCKLKGIELVVNAFDREAIRALDWNDEGYCAWQRGRSEGG